MKFCHQFFFFLEPLYYGSYPSIIEAAIHNLGVLDYEVNVQWAGSYDYYIKFISTYGEGLLPNIDQECDKIPPRFDILQIFLSLCRM